MRPTCWLTRLTPVTHVAIRTEVAATLRRHGYPSEAREFLERALQLSSDDEDTTDLLALVDDYVTVY